MDDKLKPTLQRTLVLTCGESGAAINAHLTAMLEAWGNPPVVAARQLDPAESEQDAATIDAALHDISRLSHRPTLLAMGISPDRLEELAIWAVGAPAEAVQAIARLAGQRADALLGNDALTMGIIVREGLAEADRPTSPARLLSTTTPPIFSGPCFQVMPVNEAGLALDSPATLYEHIARFLLLHTCTPLRDVPLWVTHDSMMEAQDWATFGLVWLAWPGEVAQAHGAQHLRALLLPALREKSDTDADMAELFARMTPAPALLAGQLTPRELAAITSLDIKAPAPPEFWEVIGPGDHREHECVARWREAVQSWTALLDGHEAAWAALTRKSSATCGANLAHTLAQLLDDGGVVMAQHALQAFRHALETWVIAAEEREQEAQESLTHLEKMKEQVWTTLQARLAAMPRRSLGSLFRLIQRPLQVIQLYQNWRRIQEQYTRYMQVCAAVVGASVTLRQMQQTLIVYGQVDALLEQNQAAVERVAQGLERLLALEPAFPAWPEASLLLPDDPQALLTALIAEHLPAHDALLAAFRQTWGPLSGFLSADLPEQEAVNRWLNALAAPLRDISIWEIVARRFPEPPARKVWLQELLAQARPFWRWDPTTLSDAERALSDAMTVWLTATEGVAVCAESGEKVNAAPLDSPQQLAVVSLRWGVPGV
ncbi:MAG TPA: hypothetical protein PKV20_02470 [Anaerolineae bacterium]|nr:hypothetical protein [Anaerolineae bacterium]